MAARLVDQLADIVLGMAVALDQLPIALRLLERVQILALDILDQRKLGHGRFVDLADNRRNRVELRPLRRAPAPLARDDFIILAVGRSRIGWSTPRSAIDSASSSSVSSSNWTRGWLGLGRIRATSISRTPRRLGRREPTAAAVRREAPTGPCPGPAGVLAHAATASLRQPPDHFSGEADIGLGAGAFEVVDQGRQVRGSALPTGARCAARPSRTPRAKAGADIVADRLAKVVAAVEHGQRDAEDRQLGIEGEADPLDRLKQLAEPLERKELALQRHEQVARGDQRIDRQQPERRRAIDQANVPAAGRHRA